MNTIVHFMGMHSTKFGGLEKFMVEMIKSNPNHKFVVVYESFPASLEYIDQLNRLNANVEVVPFNDYSWLRQYCNYHRIIRKYSPMVIHFHFSLNDVGALAGRLSGVKKIYKTVHSCMTRNNVPIEKYAQLTLGQRVKHCFGLANRLYTKILFVSEYTKNQYINVFGYLPSYFVAYLGVHRPAVDYTKDLYCELNIPKDYRIITSILFSHPMKGADVLIRALPYIEDCILLLIGLDNSRYTDELHELAVSLGVDEKIRWIGITDRTSDYLSITDVYVQPSRTEALSLASCEALAFGVPVVASNVGGLPEVASLVFESEDSAALAEMIISILSNKDLYSSVSMDALFRYETKFRIVDSVLNYSLLYY